MGTLLARGLLCWGMASSLGDTVTLLPAAFAVLVLQKAYGVTRSAVTPRLLPSEITLVTANARSNLGSLIATSLGAIVALGVDKLAGGGNGGAAWVLRVGTVVYLAAMLLGLRLPDRVDAVPQGTAAGGLGPTVPFAEGRLPGRRLPRQPAAAGPGAHPAMAWAAGRQRLRRIPRTPPASGGEDAGFPQSGRSSARQCAQTPRSGFSTAS